MATRPMRMKPAATSAVVRVASAPAVRSASALVPEEAPAESDGITVPPVSETHRRDPRCLRRRDPGCLQPGFRCARRAPAARVAPRIAIPSAEPTCREVDWMPDPWPERSVGMSARITLVSCAVARPMPKP